MAHNTGPILLVEDCADDAEAATHAFKKAGLANPLAHAASAEQAFAYLQASARPCLILLDLNMPGMGGRKFLETLKQDAALKDIPVVIMTASDCEQDIKSCYAMGANAYIVKSSDLAGLATAIRRLKEHWLDTVALPAVFEDGGVWETAPLPAAGKDDGPSGHRAYAPPDEKALLTPLEAETLTWISRGKSRWETGVILGVSEDTVKARLERCRQKLDASNTTHAIAIAILRGLLAQ